MSDSFYSTRFNKNVWLTNHAIESMAKRNITLAEIKLLIEARNDNLVCAAVINENAIIVKTVMVNWKE